VPVPEAPDASSIQITNVTDQSATITWAAAKGADSYRLYLSTDPDFLTLQDSFPKILLPAKPYAATGLFSNRTYYAKVQSVNTSNGKSPVAQVQFKTGTGDEDIYLNFGGGGLYPPVIFNIKANNPHSTQLNYALSNSFLSVPTGDQLIILNPNFSRYGSQVLIADNIQSLDRHSFQVNWSSAVAATSVPLVVNNTLYLGAGTKEVALNAANGQIRWFIPTGGTVKSTAVASGGRLFFTATDGFLYGVDAASGTLNWKKQIGSANLVSSPSVVNGLVVVGSDDGKVYALDINGNLQWTYQTGDAVLGSPLVANNLVYIGSTDGSLYCLDLLGNRRWANSISNRLASTPVWHAGTQSVLIADPDNNILFSFNANSGNQKWKLALQDENIDPYWVPQNHCAPIVAGSNDIYITPQKGTVLYRIKPDGTISYRYTGWLTGLASLLGSPVIYDSNNTGYYVRTFASF
jgi:outer membrane protein assembly factor BamB